MDIDYIDAGRRQETINVFALYFYIVQNNSYTMDMGHLVISFLLFIVEEGRLEGIVLTIKQIRGFLYLYISGLGNSITDESYDIEEITEFLITRLQGAKSNGEAILFTTYDGEQKKRRSAKIAYIDYDVKRDGYKITENGLELLISSKEIPQESRLTVSLYLFKLQLDRKKYKSALTTIRNINMETIRQLEIKESVLAMNRLGHEEATKKYTQYWQDYFDIRQEETNNYNDAKERLVLYRDSTYLKENDINLTPEEMDTLAAIESELTVSADLQSRYTMEISKMSGEMLDIDKRTLVNEFKTSFDLKEHFSSITSTESSLGALLYSLQPLFMPKKNKRFGLDVAFSHQTVTKKKSLQLDEGVDLHTSFYENKDLIYNERLYHNYLVFFKLLIKFLTEIKNPIINIEEFIEYTLDASGDKAVSSIDFLSFLLNLCYLPDNVQYHYPNTDNTQIIHIAKPNEIHHLSIEKIHVQELFTYFWFHEMKMDRDCELEVSTDPSRRVFIDERNIRSIGNIHISLNYIDG